MRATHRFAALGAVLTTAAVMSASTTHASGPESAAPADLPAVVAVTNTGSNMDTGATVTADCPPSSVILGGGYLVPESDAYAIVSSHPSAQAWTIQVQAVDNFVQPNDSATVFAVCGSTAVFTGGSSVESASVHVYGELDPEGPSTGTPVAICSRGLQPVGGGFDLGPHGPNGADGTDVGLLASVPYISSENGTGWSMTGHDAALSNDYFITAYAVCVPTASSPTLNYPDGTASCGSAVATGGGVVLNSGSDLSSIFPSHGVLPTAWQFASYDGSVQSTSMVCAQIPTSRPVAHAAPQ